MPASILTRVLLDNAPRQNGEPRLLHLRDTHVTDAFELRYAAVGIPLVFENCSFEQPLMMRDAEIRTLEFRSCTLPGFDGKALQVDGDLAFVETSVGRISLFGARIDGQFWLTDARVKEPGTDARAINAPGLQVAGGIYAWRLSTVGSVNLWGADVGASVEFVNASFVAHSGNYPALRAVNLNARLDVMVSGCEVEGGIDLFNARIGGQLWFNDSHIHNQEGYAVSAASAEIVGGCYARGLTAHGGVNLWGADIGAALELGGANLVGGDRPALRASGVSVKGEVTFDHDAAVCGAVDFSAATVDGGLTLNYRVDAEHALSVADAQVKTLSLEVQPAEKVRAELNGVVCTLFCDSQKAWPKVLRLDRMRYDTLRPLLPARERLAWLERNEDSDSPQVYEQLARQYREAGHDHDARVILLAKHRNRTRRLRLPGRLWGRLQDVTIGYGYRPVRALAWLAGLIAIVWICGAVWQPRPITGSAPPFNPAVYALDVVLPILNLGQEKVYSATGVGQVVVWVAILAGWLLASTVIAAVTRSIGRG